MTSSNGTLLPVRMHISSQAQLGARGEETVFSVKVGLPKGRGEDRLGAWVG
jgi:hypothetical protein